ncbi:microaggregate-binding protein 1 [Nocardia sp. CA-120079]|uniref:microaggregate-binding protein 1 n=1 Tax=Nocardia sp. CA-120079 TaxID=3239974 RepID=UPI003D97BDDD
MAEHKSGPREAAEGVVEDIKGKVKEATGAVTGHDDLRDEGRAQQDKAESQRDAARKEAEAEKERGEAAAHEARERAHQHGR